MDYEALLAAAREARTCAYAPYSGYDVGAAVQDEQGRIFAGCNVENVSYGATMCAEREAVAVMVASGGRQIVAVVVVTKDGGSPCGMCRQVIAEFAHPDLMVVAVDDAGHRTEWSFASLFPAAFKSQAVRKSE